MTHRESYDRHTSEREGFLEQAREQSRLTIPSLIPPDGTGTSYNELYKPFQSIGAFGVNALANKLSGALYPSNEPFFRLDANTTSEELEQVSPENLEAIDTELSRVEQSILRKFVARGDRSIITEAIKHLIVAGNACLFVGEDGCQAYSLDEYIAVRDGKGNLLKVITKDVLSYETFKESYPSLPDVHDAHRGNRAYDPKTIEVYTCMYRKEGMWYVEEEAAGVTIQGTKQKYPLDKPPYLALRFNKLRGQNYGRGYVENLYGDLHSLEILSRAMVEGSAINARTVTLVNPNGLTNMRLFEEADNGAVIPGQASDVSAARVDKGADLAVTANEIARLEQRLSQAFMLTSATQRDAERVTATEVNAMAQEVEMILGGVYSVLSEEFQRPYVARLMSLLQKSGDIPELPEGVVEVAIVTGTAGIGRGIDRERLVQFIQALTNTVGSDVLMQYANVETVLARLGSSFGIDLQGLLKSKEQLAQEQQQAEQMKTMESLGPNAVSAMGQVAAAQQQQGDTNANQESPEGV